MTLRTRSPAPAALMLAVGLVAALTACGEGAAVDRAGGRTPEFTGPLHVESGVGQHPEAGAAGDVVDCRTWGHGESIRDIPFGEGRTSKTAEAALDVGAHDGGFPGDQTGFREAAQETDRVLYVLDVDDVIKEAVIVHNGSATAGAGGPGWYVESWASCDYAELPRAFTDSMGLQLWFDESGVPAPTMHLQSWIGPEHCDWQTMTILMVDGETFVRDPLPEYREYFTAPYLADTRLPADAIDTGFAQEGRHLWMSHDNRQAFVGTVDSVEAWPRSDHPFLCA